ncbi:MAG TPA: hypothetical protein VD794_14380 [Flavisolibacter sp.]|nr:hypothetical protein [Flavisolibacter sp.]
MNTLLSLLLTLAAIAFTSAANGQNKYNSGDNRQDSIMRAIDLKLKQASVRTNRNKKAFGSDSLVYYSVNKRTNQLVAVGFTEVTADSRTMYDLLNGELVRVRFVANHKNGNPATVYYFENGKVIYVQQRSGIIPNGEKFIEDIVFFKSSLGVL